MNYEAVVRDVINISPSLGVTGAGITQVELERVDPKNVKYVDQALREVARRLLGRVKIEEDKPSTQIQATVWNKTCFFVCCRIQAAAEEKPGRPPDMSAAGTL